MASRDYLEMLWEHVFVGARVATVETVRTTTIIVLEGLRDAASLASETLRVELKHVGELARWHAQNELFVAGEWLVFEAQPRDGGEPCRLELPATVELGRVQNTAGKSLSQMKLHAVARPYIEAASGAPGIDLLREIRDLAIANVHDRLLAAGFRGSSPIWVRNVKGCMHAVEHRGSRFSTGFLLGFSLECFVFRGETTKTPRTFDALVMVCDGPSGLVGPPGRSFSVIAVDPSRAVDEATAYAEEALRWLDGHRTLSA